MALLDVFIKKKEIVLGAPAKGESAAISEVSDPIFGKEILGKGVAVKPANGAIFAPTDGVVSTAFPTGHAVAIISTDGVEILIHVGLDTVQLNGKYFELKVKENQKVKKGDALLVADIQKIQKEGYDNIISMVICNTSDYTSVEAVTGVWVEPGDTILCIQR